MPTGARSYPHLFATQEKPPDDRDHSPSPKPPPIEPVAWSSPGPAAYDFRSDTSTTPTQSMLNAISHTTLLDDVIGADPTTNALESFMCDLTDHESAVLVSSGTMGNQIAIRSHLGSPPHSILVDYRSHVANWEAGGAASLSQAMVIRATPHNGRFLKLEDVLAFAELDTDFHKCPTKLICLENTLGGEIMPLEVCAEICDWAHANGIMVHLDGARLWEAVAALCAEGHWGGELRAGLRAYARPFDSVQMCFSKGLGAPIGSILLGPVGMIRKARHVRKSIGGGMRMTGIIAAPARVAIEETFFGGKLVKTHEVAKRVGEMWENRGGRLIRRVRTNMVWIDLMYVGVPVKRFVEVAQQQGVEAYGERIVCHYQICEPAIRALGKVFDIVLEEAKNAKEGKGLNGTIDEATDKKASEILAQDME